jgi:hypothetical protein
VLSAGTTAILNTSFVPSVSGNASGVVKVNSDATNAATISLAGTGIQPSSHSVLLSWNASTSNVIGYYVYRATAGGSYTKLNSVPVGDLQFTDRSVQVSQTYTYAVTSVDANNEESSYSTPVTAIVPAT